MLLSLSLSLPLTPVLESQERAENRPRRAPDTQLPLLRTGFWPWLQAMMRLANWDVGVSIFLKLRVRLKLWFRIRTCYYNWKWHFSLWIHFALNIPFLIMGGREKFQTSAPKVTQPFHVYPERVHMALLWVQVITAKGNFHEVCSPRCPANEGGECPQIPCSRNPLRRQQPWLPHATAHLQQEKWWCPQRNSAGDLGGAWAIVTTANPAAVSVMPSRNTSQRAVLEFAAAPAATPGADASPREPSLTRPRQPPGSHSFWGLLVPGLAPSLPQTRVTLARRPLSVHHRLSSALCGQCHPCSNKGLTQRVWTAVVDAGLGSSVHVWYCLLWIPMGSRAWSPLPQRS